MTACFKIKEHQVSSICSYAMLEVRSTMRTERRYTISKYINGKFNKSIVIPVSKQTAEAVWSELEANDWKS